MNRLGDDLGDDLGAGLHDGADRRANHKHDALWFSNRAIRGGGAGEAEKD